MRSFKRPASLLFASVLVLAAQLPAQQSVAGALPQRLSDAEFWKLATELSEPGGYFQSDNFASNELTYPQLFGRMRARGDTGSAYLGVGPEQNFHYIAETRPRIAFIVDIRRQAAMHHMMYKAIFELSKDRADFISLLFSKPRPAGLDTASTIAAIWEAYWFVPTDTAAYPANLARITDHLTKTHAFALDSNDIASLTYVYEAFYRLGPVITYGGYGAGFAGQLRLTVRGTLTGGTVNTGTITGTTTGGTYATWVSTTGGAGFGPGWSSYYGGVNFASLTASMDEAGVPRSFLATEISYRFLKDLHTRNMFIPVTGDFAGPKAIRAVGQYVRDHGATFSAIYTSNVEQYLFQNNVWRQYYQNVGTLPVTPTSIFIRNGTSICPITGFLGAFAAQRVNVYADATRCAQ